MSTHTDDLSGLNAATPGLQENLVNDDSTGGELSDYGTVQRYRIEHVTRYSYSQRVTLDQLVLRIQPRTGPAQRLIEFTINIDPKPSKHTHGIDLHGNIRHWFWFDRSHDHLNINVQSTVDCRNENPFDYIIVDPGVERVPVRYEEPIHSAAAHYRKRTDLDPDIDAFADDVARSCDGTTIGFLWALVTRLHEQIDHVARHEGHAWRPHETLAKKNGACRDEALLFVEACRAMGLAARFVSGYAWDAIEDDQREMHAWAEVYVPGGGWRGYDSTLGRAVSNEHIAVAASPTATYAAPLSGTFTAPPLESTLDYAITMTQESIPRPPNDGLTYRWG